ncbi:MAG: hypothetical protein IT340_05455 [Chloroflexi bacterium]|nr:hypothetical protein [Chloroflexota bacterium]
MAMAQPPASRRVDEADVRAAMASMEARVRERRRLLGAGAATGGQDEVRAVADNWFVSAHLPITWDTPVVGRALALAKRVTRLLLRWYINPIVDQQNDFNAAAARAFVHLSAQQEALARSIEAIELRVQALEARPGAGPAAGDGGTGG